MLKLKQLTRFALVVGILVIGLSALNKTYAQEDGDEGSAITTPNSDQPTPPVMIDESDATSVPDVEDYDS